MTVPNTETGLLNFYRASQLHSGLILGQLARRTNDARLILNLTRHCAEEVMHAQLWTETIIAIGGRPAVSDTYQARCAAAVGAPSTLLEVLAETQIFERRIFRQFTLHLRLPGIHPAIATTLRRMIPSERAHVTWVKGWLGEQAKSRRTEVRDLIRKYSVADERIYDALTTEFSVLRPLRVA